MSERKPISKRMRFDVLKRDAFTCQYCGKMPPDTTLHIDHIKPVSKGGKNTLINLVTSCIDCNLGKSDKELSDDSAIKKQQAQLSALAERRSQIEMMVDWRESLLKADELLVESVTALVNKYLEPYDLHTSKSGIDDIRRAVKKHGYQACIDAIESAYVSGNDFDCAWYKSLAYIGKQNKKSIHYIKGILRNRFSYLNERRFYTEISDHESCGVHIDIIEELAKSCCSVNDFFSRVEDLKCQ